jgi:hypothetical protein
MNKYIYITYDFEGFHKYEKAPEEVKYLRNEHRHLFKLKIYIEVFHDDREIEFFIFKKFIKGLISNNDFNLKSCEQISDDLHHLIQNKYANRKIIIDISEDGENGSYIVYPSYIMY